MSASTLPHSRAAAAPSPRDRWWIEGLDGMRAMAIIAVLIFHLRPASLPGGFIGVDVFFVISGFLITTLLVRELKKRGRINLPSFWLRRARRLLPGLVTVVLVSTVAAFFAGGDLLVGIRRHVLGALTFSNNWVEISAGSDYFAASTPNLFMNFWSLAVEEQFYLLWPILAILIMAALPTGRSRVLLLGAGALASAIAMAAAFTPDAITRVYYGTDTHAFGLLIGAGLAFAMAAPDITFFDGARWQRLRVPLLVGGFAVIVALMFTVDGESAFAYRGGLVLASLATAAMVASLPGRATAGTAVLKLRPLEWVGVRSYGIYMWHWPVILIVEQLWPATTPDTTSWWISRTVALTATLALAALSFTLVENPVRIGGFAAAFSGVGRWWRAVPARGRSISAAAALLVAGVFAAALITAPAQSTLEQSMAAAGSYVNGEADAAAAPAPRAAGTEPSDPDSSDTEPNNPEPNNPELVDPEPANPEPIDPGAQAAEELFAARTGTDESGEEVAVPGSQVYGIGDSMMYVAAPGLAKRIPGMVINAESNRQWPHIAESITQAVRAGKVGPVVVIAGGTNAGARDVEVITGALEELGPHRQVVLVNIYSGSSWVEESNANLAAIAKDRDNVAIADWHAAVTEHPEQLQPDKIHPNMEGMYLWADTVVAALGDLGITIAEAESTTPADSGE